MSRHRGKHNAAKNFGEDIEREAESTFDKRFTYSTLCDDGQGLDIHTDIFTSEPWIDPQLQALKVRISI